MSRLDAVLVKRRDVLIAIIVLAVLWSVTVLSPQIYHFPPDPFYFVKQLPLTYWFGIAVLCSMFTLFIYQGGKEISSQELIAIVIILIFIAVYLFGLPSFIYSNPRYLDVYRYSFTVHQMAIGNLDSYPNLGSVYTTEFQGTTILFAMLEILTGIDTLVFAKYYPLYSILILASAVIITARLFSKRPVDLLIAGVAYICLAWVQAYHLCPQSHALLLGSFILYLLVALFLSAPRSESYHTKLILLLIFWAAVCISHSLTPIILLTTMGILIFSTLIIYLGRYYSPIDFWSAVGSDGNVPVRKVTHLAVLLVIVYLSYLLISSDFLLDRIISTINHTISNLIEGNTMAVVDRNVEHPAPSYFICYTIRMLTSVSVMVAGVIGIVYTAIRQGMTKKTWLPGSLFFGLSTLGVYLIVAGYNTYGSDRSYIFLLIPFSILVMFVLGTCGRETQNSSYYSTVVRYLFLAFIISQIILFPITKYSSDPYGFISESELSGDSFALNYVDYDYPFSTPHMYTNLGHNLIQLKQQKGDYYKKSFQGDDLNRIYDGGQILIHILIEG